MKPKFYDHYNRPPARGEINELPSATVPGMSMTVSEMLEKYTKGVLPTNDPKMVWEDREIPLPRINDLTDLEEINAYITSLENKVKEAKARKSSALAEAKANNNKENDNVSVSS